MKLDTGISLTPNAKAIAEQAKALEAEGFDGMWGSETNHDPFLPLAVAAAATDTIEIGTSIAVAFARTPMLLANIAWDLQAMSQGRFHLGLGSQIKPHITKRFDMPWSKPAARMKELIEATRAIWNCWLTGEALDFRGEFYTNTLMTPFFSPPAEDLGDHGLPKIHLAGVGELMTQAAGEVCDGFLCHGFTTERYIREVTIPNLQIGLERSGRTLDDFSISGPVFVVTGSTDAEIAESDAAARRQIAFYGSTPAYRGVLELHGWNDLQPRLNTLSKQGKWDEMGDLVTDEILETFAVVEPPERVAAALDARYGDIVDRLSFYGGRVGSGETTHRIISDLAAIDAARSRP